MTDPTATLAAASAIPEVDSFGVWLAEKIGADTAAISDMHRLTGGAVNTNIAFRADVTGGKRAGRHHWVLRTGIAEPSCLGLDRSAEFAVMRAAFAAGVHMPEPIACCTAASPTGQPFLVMEFRAGVGAGHKIARDPALETFGPALAATLGRELAKIHAIRPPREDLPDLVLPSLSPARAEIARLHAALDRGSEPRPALEYVLRWLDLQAPEPQRIVLVHGDFRTGNYLVDNGQLTGILDWDIAHWGDAREDLGWFAARCWRFGNDAKVAGGLSRLATFLDAYNAATDVKVTAQEIAYWEVFAAARWAAMAAIQGARSAKVGGGRMALELALTGLMAPEMELDALNGIDAFERGKR